MITRETIHQLYALTGAGRWDEAAAYLTEDFVVREAESLPYGGDWEGRDALQRLYTHVFTFWADPEIEFHDITVSDDTIVSLLTIHATSRHNGERLAMKVAEVFHLRDGRISGITPYYFDTMAIVRATGGA